MLGAAGVGILAWSLARLVAGLAWLALVAVWRTLALLFGAAVTIGAAVPNLPRPTLRRARRAPPERPSLDELIAPYTRHDPR